VLFGLAPAIRASAAWPASAAAFGDRSLTAHAGMAHSLIATQIAFSLMILFVATLLLRSSTSCCRSTSGSRRNGWR
jgi:hypothetical protein